MKQSVGFKMPACYQAGRSTRPRFRRPRWKR